MLVRAFVLLISLSLSLPLALAFDTTPTTEHMSMSMSTSYTEEIALIQPTPGATDGVVSTRFAKRTVTRSVVTYQTTTVTRTTTVFVP